MLSYFELRWPASRESNGRLRESPDSHELSQGSQSEPIFSESCFEALKNCESQVETIRANRSTMMKTGVFL